jgi:segregation and condensation protein B
VTKGEVVQFPSNVPEAQQGLSATLEALVFASGEAVSVADLCEAAGVESPGEVREVLRRLQKHYEHPSRGIRLVELGGRWQFQTVPSSAQAVSKLLGAKPKRLSAAASETLAVIAYRQPVTKAEIDKLRGVDSGGVLRGLLDRDLIRVSGRRQDMPGRPLQYATTRGFLELYSLSSLAELPTLAEREELIKYGDEPEED